MEKILNSVPLELNLSLVRVWEILHITSYQWLCLTQLLKTTKLRLCNMQNNHSAKCMLHVYMSFFVLIIQHITFLQGFQCNAPLSISYIHIHTHTPHLLYWICGSLISRVFCFVFIQRSGQCIATHTYMAFGSFKSMWNFVLRPEISTFLMKRIILRSPCGWVRCWRSLQKMSWMFTQRSSSINTPLSSKMSKCCTHIYSVNEKCTLVSHIKAWG